MKKMVDSVFREDIEYVYGIMYFFCGLARRSRASDFSCRFPSFNSFV